MDSCARPPYQNSDKVIRIGRFQRAIQTAVFLLLFLALYAALNYYVLARFTALFGWSRTPLFFIALAALSLSAIIATVVEKRWPNETTRIVYLFAMTWMGVLGIAVLPLALLQLAHAVATFAIRREGTVIASVVLLLTAYALVNAQRVRVKTVRLPIPGLKRPVRLAQLTDIHVGTVRNSGFLAHLVRMTNRLKPDIVAITGDLVDGSGALAPHLFDPLGDIKAPAFFSNGNHEFYEGVDACMEAIKHTGVRVLRGEAAMAKGVQLIGVDYAQAREYLSQALPRIAFKKGVPTVLLNHTPEGFDAAAHHGINLMLSGHTHAGQLFPVNFLVLPFHRHVHGLYRKDTTVHARGKRQGTTCTTWLYVSPGTGTWGPPMRLGSRNEITVFDLVAPTHEN